MYTVNTNPALILSKIQCFQYENYSQLITVKLSKSHDCCVYASTTRLTFQKCTNKIYSEETEFEENTYCLSLDSTEQLAH